MGYQLDILKQKETRNGEELKYIVCGNLCYVSKAHGKTPKACILWLLFYIIFHFDCKEMYVSYC